MPVVFLSSPFLADATGKVVYPTQSAKARPQDAQHAGELRLFYKGENLTPKSSTWGMVRTEEIKGGGTKPKPHNGVDIYAEAYAFPVEIPVVAVCDGTVSFHFFMDRRDNMGNRAWLVPTGLPTVRLIYGHLSRFEGRGRPVVAGEVIGYVGCSGNADFDGGCSKPGQSFNISTSHLHLTWTDEKKKYDKDLKDLGQTSDPLPLLGWTLRYADDLAPIKRSVWEDRGERLRNPILPPERRGRLKVLPLVRDARKKMPVLAGSLHLARVHSLTVADRTALQTTELCYVRAKDRWTAEKPDSATTAERGAGLAAFGSSVDALAALKVRLAGIGERLVKIRDALQPTQGSTDSPPIDLVWEAHALLAEAMLQGMEAVWHAAGGPATAATGRVRTPPPAKKGEPPPPTPAPSVPDAAFGLNGRSYVLALDQGVAGLHRSVLVAQDGAMGPPEPFSEGTVVVGFGPGSGRHAVLDEGMAVDLPDSLTEPYGAVDALVQALEALAQRIARIVPSADALILASQIEDIAAGTGPIELVERLAAATDATAKRFKALSVANRAAWLSALAVHGDAALGVVAKMLAPKSVLIAAPNNFQVVLLQPPPLAAEKTGG